MKGNSKKRISDLNASHTETPAPEEEDIALTIDLDDPYQDNDFKIYFDKASLLAHLNFLEDDNLFKINLLQDEE